ncbi:uncharacterized protein MEPE_03539 [Melanopsichium pennsylvanicum]|uniref:LysM domain-containing protein n=2 Tax=Melanopsichium pennsylvanicum TaxID=63383 RepID=A0AAJ4XLL7_9BASI|nr:putative protein [Melanopsichium pennsylvanicum 4]SNX84830.1 uncharacterized protein MEPE_03539 [Melanopsichium pennsylvanicum]
MSASPWLPASSSNHAPNVGASNNLDPWATIDSEYLGTSSSSSSSQQQQLRSRKSSPSFLSASTTTTNAQVVDRHPLRSPSPRQGVAGPSNLVRPDAAPRRPSAVASEWKAIGAGLAGLFGGSSSSANSSGYQWPADPTTTGSSIRASRQSALHSGTPIPYHDDDDDDDARKSRFTTSVESTLDRLEGWFGLRQQQQQHYHHHHHQQQQQSSSHTSDQIRRPAVSSSATKSDGTEQVRVLIHPVAPTDTLHSLALHYGADIQVLRKSNKLWPGDPVQIRKVVYIPIDSCKHRPPNAEIKIVSTKGGAVSSEPTAATLAFVPKAEEDDLLTGTPTAEIAQPNLLANNLAPMRVSDPVSDFMPDTNKSYVDSISTFGTSLTRAGSVNGVKQSYPPSLTPALRILNQTQISGSSTKRPTSSVGGGSNTASVTASASAASSGFVPPRQPLHVAKMPADQLRFFANDAKSSISTASGSLKPGPGDAEYHPGESGIDDLLALASNPLQSGMSAADSARPALIREVSSSNLSGFDDEDEEWKPNTWHFGDGSNKSRSQRRNHSNTGLDGSEEGGRQRHYAGWNDAPPPNAIVAKAYDGGKAQQRRQAQKSHRLLYDLAAGLPANPGAASKWARPIQFGDSLPSGPPGVPGGASGSGSMPARLNSAKGGFGKLLDDTIRGRISVEAALGGALEGVRAKTAPLPQTVPQRSAALAPPPMQTRSQPSLAPPPPAQSIRAQIASVISIDPLSSSSMMRSSSALEHRRRVNCTKGKDN